MASINVVHAGRILTRNVLAVAIAGGFSPRAQRDSVTLTHAENTGASRTVVPLGTAVSPGDTVLVGERWF